MKPETPLDSVLFQLDETRTRCELWIAAGDSSERLASGYLTPFLSHLPTVHEQLARGGGGGDVIRLQAPACPTVQGSPWFTKRTIERFVRFVSTPDVLERVNFLEAERLKLAEASNILISSLPGCASDATTNADASFRGEPAFQSTQPGVHSLDSLEVETESSRRHLVNAMDARRLALEKEQRKAFARAAAAGFSIDSLRDLMAFADSFGAARLREACLQFGELHTKLKEPEPDNPANSANSANSTNSANHMNSNNNLHNLSNSNNNYLTNCSITSDVEEAEPRGIYRAGELKNYGRRRVWGPPVAGIPLQGVNNVPGSDGMKDADGALTGEDGESPIKSTTSSSSGSRESDWEDAEGSGINPVYENVMRPLVTRVSESSGMQPEGRHAAEGKNEPAPVRRTGIVVIRNVKLPHGVSSKQSETESDMESAESESDSKAGRLSVRAAISLFETKQKQQSSDVGAKPHVKQSGKQDQTSLYTNSDSAMKEAGKRGGKVTMPEKGTTSGPNRPSSGNNVLKSGSNRLQVAPPETQKPPVQPKKVEKETVVKETPSTAPRPTDELSKELLDRSYSCLLQINSVVQDALLSASALQQGAAQVHVPEPAKVNVETEPEKWRAGSSLDDMFLARKAPAPGSSRRQSLCTYECSSEKVVKTAEPVAAPGDQLKGRLYDQYQERREAKYKRESSVSKTEREAKLKAMQEVLEIRRVELLSRRTRLPEKNNTLSAEQMKALKFEAGMKNGMLTSNRKEQRSGMHEKPPPPPPTTATRRPPNITRPVQKQESPTSRGTTRKLSPGPLPPKAAPAVTLKNSTRLNSSPRSKLSSGPPVSQRRVGSFMSQSVISESLHSQADLRKENARPPRRSSLNSYAQETSKYSQPRETNRSVAMPLETNRVVSANLVNETRKSYGTGKSSGGQVLAPLKITRDMAAEQNGNSVSSRIPRAPKPARVSEPKVTSVKAAQAVQESRCEVAETSAVPVARSSDECIKQIVSCNNTKERQQEEVRSDSTLSVQPLNESPKSLEAHRPSKQESMYQSKDFDEDMQIDDEVEKCMSGRPFLQGISASPLINNFGKVTEEYKQEVSCSLRSGPSSQSLPHLPRSISPPATISCFRPDACLIMSQAKETRAVCKEHHQAKEQQPKGLKRLLKFGRKHRSSDSNLAEWSTINEESVSESKKNNKKNGVETPSRTSGVRRSLEALPKIADAASEISRNFFSSFRSKSSVCDSRSRA